MKCQQSIDDPLTLTFEGIIHKVSKKPYRHA